MASSWSLCAFSLSFIESPSAPADLYSYPHSAHTVLLLFILLSCIFCLGRSFCSDASSWGWAKDG